VDATRQSIPVRFARFPSLYLSPLGNLDHIHTPARLTPASDLLQARSASSLSLSSYFLSHSLPVLSPLISAALP
jgi:hypothetical protein